MGMIGTLITLMELMNADKCNVSSEVWGVGSYRFELSANDLIIGVFSWERGAPAPRKNDKMCSYVTLPTWATNI